jgi:excisionase family DNA binding protein
VSGSVSPGSNGGARSAAPPRLLTVEEARVELHIGRTLAYQLVESGALPVVRIGHALRVRRADLDAYVEANLSWSAGR